MHGDRLIVDFDGVVIAAAAPEAVAGRAKEQYECRNDDGKKDPDDQGPGLITHLLKHRRAS